MLITLVLLRHRDRPALTRPALLMFVVFLGQIALGFSTAAVLSPDSRTYDVTFWQITAPSLHQAIGALLFALQIRIALIAWRRRIAVGRDVPRPTGVSVPPQGARPGVIA